MTRKILISLLVLGLFFAAAGLPAYAGPLVEGDYYCSPSLDGCGKLGVHTQNGSTVDNYAETYTYYGDYQEVRAKICEEHHTLIGWQTDHCADSGDQYDTGVLQATEFTCTSGVAYKFYSDHWVNSNYLTRIEGDDPPWTC